MEQRETWVTTIDNPFDPFEDFENWKRFDEEKGYYTTELMGRMVSTHDDMSEDAQLFQLESAVDRVVALNLLGIYKKAIKGENNVSSEENRKKAENFMKTMRANLDEKD